MSEHLFTIFPNERFVDLGLYQFGWEKCDSMHSYGPFARNHYLFHYVISGTGTLLAADSQGIDHEYRVKSGQGFLICPKQVATYSADKTYPWEYTWVEFDGVRVTELLNMAGLSPNSPIYHSRDRSLSRLLLDEMLYLVHHPNESPFHLIGHLYLVMDYLSQSNTNNQKLKLNTLKNYYVKEALSFIEQNFQNNISIEDIAAFCNLNRSYFGTIFKQAMGKSPQQFLLSYRMSKATQLLKLTDMSIADVGNAVGYPNQLHFSRAFKNQFQISPKQWRTENRIS